MEFHLQSSCAHLEVTLTDVGDQWAQFAIAGQRAREDLAVMLLPGAAMDQNHHRVRPGAGRQVQIGALGGVRTVAMGLPAREELEDQACAGHVGPMLEGC